MRIPFTLVVLIAVVTGCATRYPRGSGNATSPPGMAERLRAAVTALCGERNVYHPEALQKAAAFIGGQFAEMGYAATWLPVTLDAAYYRAKTNVTYNLEVVIPGADPSLGTLVVGAHYDSRVAMKKQHSEWPPLPDQAGTPGANDNASGVAALLEVARHFQHHPPRRPVRLVAFGNEEPPFWQRRTDVMGSLVYARGLRAAQVKVDLMISLETMGCYQERPNTRRTFLASLLGLPNRPDYVAFLSNMKSRRAATDFATRFARRSSVDAYTFPLPAFGDVVGWSDDWAFWQTGVSAFCVTDTAFLRSDDYHSLDDLPEHMNFDVFAEVVTAVNGALHEIANP